MAQDGAVITGIGHGMAIIPIGGVVHGGVTGILLTMVIR